MLANDRLKDLTLMNEISTLYQCLHIGQPDKVIEAACKTVGVSLGYIHKIIEDRSGSFDDLNSITVSDWFHICLLLKIDINSLQYGYSPYVHQRRIGEAVYKGNYSLPNTIEVRDIWKRHKAEMKKERRSELKYYGGNLKRRIRLSHIKSDLQFLLNRLGKKPNNPNLTFEQEYFS